VDRIAKEVARALAAQDVRERLAKLSAETMNMTPAEFGHFVRSEADSVARIVRAAGIKPQ
jgi:tripartite-type tricarboxylate transporter receptor subunit TctC